MIEKIILESEDKKLHLSEIYEAFKRKNIYFTKQTKPNNSSGWKVIKLSGFNYVVKKYFTHAGDLYFEWLWR